MSLTSPPSTPARGLHPRVFERQFAGLQGAIEDLAHELFELGPVQLELQVLRPAGVGGDERQIDLRLAHRGQLALGLLGRLLQTLQGHLVLRQVDPLLFLELGDDPVDQLGVQIVAAEVRVAVGRLDLHDPFADLEDRDVERPAAEVEDGDGLVGFPLQPVSQRRRGRLVDDALDGQTGDLPGVLGRLALGVVEVGGHCDDRARHLLAQVGLGGLLQLAQDERRDLRRRVLLVLDLDPHVAVVRGLDVVRDHLDLFLDLVELAAHEALGREDGVLGIGDRLPLGHLADQALALVVDRHDGGRGAVPLRIGDDGRFAAFHDGDHGVGRSEIDTDDLAHCTCLLTLVGSLLSEASACLRFESEAVKVGLPVRARTPSRP
jgi:hypothetical protein